MSKIITGPLLLACGEEFEQGDHVYVNSEKYKCKGEIVFIDKPYRGIVIRDDENEGISYYIEIDSIEDIYKII